MSKAQQRADKLGVDHDPDFARGRTEDELRARVRRQYFARDNFDRSMCNNRTRPCDVVRENWSPYIQEMNKFKVTHPQSHDSITKVVLRVAIVAPHLFSAYVHLLPSILMHYRKDDTGARRIREKVHHLFQDFPDLRQKYDLHFLHPKVAQGEQTPEIRDEITPNQRQQMRVDQLEQHSESLAPGPGQPRPVSPSPAPPPLPRRNPHRSKRNKRSLSDLVGEEDDQPLAWNALPQKKKKHLVRKGKRVFLDDNEKYLEVRRSTLKDAGLGLFSKVDLEVVDTVLGDYKKNTKQITEETMRDKKQKNEAQYIIKVTSPKLAWYDGNPAVNTGQNIMRYANDGGDKNNARLEAGGLVSTTKPIKAGEEILFSYGETYWKAKTPSPGVVTVPGIMDDEDSEPLREDMLCPYP